MYLVDRSFFIKRHRLTHTCPKTRGPSKSQKHAGRTKQVSQFTMKNGGQEVARI